MRPRLFLVLVGLALLAAGPLPAADFFVDTKLLDATDWNPGDGKCEWATLPPVGQRCTLRAAVHEANALPGPDFIYIPDGWTITLSRAGAGEDLNISGDLDILDEVWIQGLGSATLDAAGIDRVFDIHSPAEVVISNLVITGGKNGIGAGVNVRSGAAGGLSGCRLTGNQGLLGVALYAGGESAMAGCTVEGNRQLPGVTSSSSVLRAVGSGSLWVNRSTIAANRSVTVGVSNASLTTIISSTIANNFTGVESTSDLFLRNVTIYGNENYGLYHVQPVAFGSPSIFNSVIAGNGSPPDSPIYGGDCLISSGFSDIAHPNLDGDGSCGFSPGFGGIPNTDPLLGPLRDNGGPTHTMAPQIVGGTQSPVIDRGDNDTCESDDQRLVDRPLDGDVFILEPIADCDLGAVESLPCDTAPPGLSQHGSLGNGTTVACFNLAAGPATEIQAGATHEFRARQMVELRNGFRVLDGATFSVIIDPQAGSSVHPPW